MNIEISDKAARAQVVVDVEDVVLARHLPLGDGTLTYLSPATSRVISMPLSCDDVMAAVFAGVSPIDVEA